MTITGTLGSNGEIETIDKLSIATIGTLTLDAGRDADSRHPGTPLGSAPPVHTLWRNFLLYDPFVLNWLKLAASCTRSARTTATWRCSAAANGASCVSI